MILTKRDELLNILRLVQDLDTDDVVDVDQLLHEECEDVNGLVLVGLVGEQLDLVV